MSQLERDIGSDQFPPNEHYFGLVNVRLNISNITLIIICSLYTIVSVLKLFTIYFSSLETLVTVIQCFKHFIFVNLFEIKYWSIKLAIREIKRLCSRVWLIYFIVLPHKRKKLGQ